MKVNVAGSRLGTNKAVTLSQFEPAKPEVVISYCNRNQHQLASKSAAVLL